MGGGGPVMAWSVLAGVSQPLMHDMALMQPEGDGCAAAQEGPRPRMSVPQQQSSVCGGASGLKAGVFNCSMALSPAQHLAKQVCSCGIMSTGVPALRELNKAQQSLLLAPTPSITSLLAEPPGSSVSPGNAFKD